MQAGTVIGIPDVHAGALPDRIEPLQYLNIGAIILILHAFLIVNLTHMYLLLICRLFHVEQSTGLILPCSTWNILWLCILDKSPKSADEAAVMKTWLFILIK